MLGQSLFMPCRAKKVREERQAGDSAKRRKMTEELERREKAFASERNEEHAARARLKVCNLCSPNAHVPDSSVNMRACTQQLKSKLLEYASGSAIQPSAPACQNNLKGSSKCVPQLRGEALAMRRG